MHSIIPSVATVCGPQSALIETRLLAERFASTRRDERWTVMTVRNAIVSPFFSVYLVISVCDQTKWNMVTINYVMFTCDISNACTISQDTGACLWIQIWHGESTQIEFSLLSWTFDEINIVILLHSNSVHFYCALTLWYNFKLVYIWVGMWNLRGGVKWRIIYSSSGEITIDRSGRRDTPSPHRIILWWILLRRRLRKVHSAKDKHKNISL